MKSFLGYLRKRFLNFPAYPKPLSRWGLETLLSTCSSTMAMMKTWQSDEERLIYDDCLVPAFSLAFPSHSIFYFPISWVTWFNIFFFFYSFPPFPLPPHPSPPPPLPLLLLLLLLLSLLFHLLFLLKACLDCDFCQLPLRVLIINPLEIILFLFGSVTQMYFIHMLLFWQINVSTAQQQTIDTSEVSSVF